MLRFRYEGQEFEEIVPTVGETRWLEREIGYPLSQWGDAERMHGSFLLTVRRNQVMLTWKDIDAMPMGAIEILDDDEGGEADPQTPGVEAGTGSTGDGPSTSSGSPGTSG